MKKILNALLIVMVATSLYVFTFHSDWLVVPPPFLAKASALSSDKSVDECSPTATVGRCADKCPAPTSEGVYFERGTDENGAAICGFSFYHACPYTEAVSADDPLCYKAGQEQQVQQQQDQQAMQAIQSSDFGGK